MPREASHVQARLAEACSWPERRMQTGRLESSDVGRGGKRRASGTSRNSFGVVVGTDVASRRRGDASRRRDGFSPRIWVLASEKNTGLGCLQRNLLLLQIICVLRKASRLVALLL